MQTSSFQERGASWVCPLPPGEAQSPSPPVHSRAPQGSQVRVSLRVRCPLDGGPAFAHPSVPRDWQEGVAQNRPQCFPSTPE